MTLGETSTPVAVPCAVLTMLLARAEVIKIEHPVRGDDTRAWGPPYAKYKPGSNEKGPGEAAYFLGVRPAAVVQPIRDRG